MTSICDAVKDLYQNRMASEWKTVALSGKQTLVELHAK